MAALIIVGSGYITGIISDSYDCITNHLKNKFGFDFTISNELEFSKSIATGEVKIPSLFLQDEKSQCKHEYCKLNALKKFGEAYVSNHMDECMSGKNPKRNIEKDLKSVIEAAFTL